MLAKELAALPWSKAVCTIQSTSPSAVDEVALRDNLQLLLAQEAADEAALGDLIEQSARGWSRAVVPELAMSAQLQVLLSLKTWLLEELSASYHLHLHHRFDLVLAQLCRDEAQQEAAQQERQSRLAFVGQLFASIAHELRNPLAVVESSVFLLRRQLEGDESSTRHLHKITRNVTRCHDIIHEVLEMVRDAPLRGQELRALDIWEDVKAHCVQFGSLDWELDVPEHLVLRCEPRLMRQCLLNLIHNARVAMHGQGSIHCRSRELESGQVLFEVKDSGPGFPSEWIARGVQCLVSRHPQGTGLGLALAQSIAQRHGGALELSNHDDGGACVRVMIPRG